MTDKADGATTAQKEEANKFHILRVYTKDVSFESPQSPDIFLRQGNWSPQVSLQLNNGARKLADSVYEVSLNVTVTAKLDEEVLYLIEVKQAGLFQIEGFTEPTTGVLLGSYCPNALFPYVRETMSSMVSKGSFPQLLLEPINFDALYQQHMQQRAVEEKAKNANATENKAGATEAPATEAVS